MGTTTDDAPLESPESDVDSLVASTKTQTTPWREGARQAGSMPPCMELDDWQFDDDRRTVHRVLQSLGQRTIRTELAHPQDQEPAPDLVPTAPAPPVATTLAAATSNANRRNANSIDKKSTNKSSWFSWLLIAMGLTTFVCGAVLLGWYFFDGREQLWRMGLPLALGGQVVLLFGLIVQLEALWQSNRGTGATLHELDEQIDELRHTTSVLGSTRNNAAKSFYLHMAEDASPNVMLADLKGQLDILALKMARQR